MQAPAKKVLKAFLAHPVSDFQSSDGSYRPEKEQFLSAVIEAIQHLGIEVHCAATNEDYGRIKLEPEEFTRYDVDSIRNSELFLLVTSERVTRDMYLELGIAYAKSIPIFLFVPASAYRRHVTYMLLGFEAAGEISITSFDSEGDVPGLVQESVGKFLEARSK